MILPAPAEHSSRAGFALIIVMLVVVALTILAGGFAYTMKVETRLARNNQFESDLRWMGRSGVEFARYILAQQMTVSTEPYDALNQFWAGGVGVTNEVFRDLTLNEIPLGPGRFSVEIIDQERMFNINVTDQVILEEALTMIGVEVSDFGAIVDSILDWRDRDDQTRINGRETEYYQELPRPYVAKNGPIDDLSELLLIYGITPQMYHGYSASDRLGQLTRPEFMQPFSPFGDSLYQVGLVDLFTPISGGLININTAPAPVLELVPGIDEGIASGIIQLRAGPDGVEGNEDDIPFRNPGELVNVPGITRGVVEQATGIFTVRSATFLVKVDVQVGELSRQYRALLRRNNAQDIQVLSFHWHTAPEDS